MVHDSHELVRMVKEREIRPTAVILIHRRTLQSSPERGDWTDCKGHKRCSASRVHSAVQAHLQRGKRAQMPDLVSRALRARLCSSAR